MPDQRIQYTERMVGAGHPTLTDTLNRITLVEHENDGTHKAGLTVPVGGTTGQVLTKASDTDRDVTWSSDSSSLAGLIDVELTTPASGQILRFNGTKWVNSVDLAGIV